MNEVTYRILKEADKEKLIQFLLPRLESSMFLAGNMQLAGLEDRGKRYQGTYAAAFEGGQIVAVVAHYWNKNLVLQAGSYLTDLISFVTSSTGRPVGGILGLDQQVRVAFDYLGWQSDEMAHDEAEYLYSLKLDQLVDPIVLQSTEVTARAATPTDSQLLCNWRLDYMEETLGIKKSTMARKQARISIEESINLNQAWMLEFNGTPVSCSMFNAVVNISAKTTCVQIGGVWTLPQFRGNGYARAVVAHSLKQAYSKGVERAILFTPESNLPAQKAYIAIGFKRIGTYRIALRAD